LWQSWTGTRSKSSLVTREKSKSDWST
jgi:hypothetical protein